MNYKFVSIIIPTRNEGGYIESCINSILNGTYPYDNLEILVVDGRSTDNTRDIISGYTTKYPFIKLIDNPKRTVPFAMNAGIRASQGEIIVRIDAHADYPPDYIEKLVFWMDKLNADNVGAVLITAPANNTLKAKAIVSVISHPFGVGLSRFRIGVSKPTEVDTVPFGCYRREIFDRIGMYDEQLTRNQDDEFNARLIKNGGKIYLIPEITIIYYARDTFSKLWKMFYQYGYFKPLVNIKIGYPTSLRQLAPLLFVSFLFTSFMFALWDLRSLFLVLLMIIPYLVLSTQMSIIRGLKMFPFILVGFLVVHTAYGYGYIRGIIDFILLNKHHKRNIEIDLSR